MPRQKVSSDVKTRACPSCGQNYDAAPPDDAHDYLMIEKPAEEYLRLGIALMVNHECLNCHKQTTLYWVDLDDARRHQYAEGGVLTEAEFNFIQGQGLDDIKCEVCHHFGYYSVKIGRIQEAIVLVCANAKCRTVLGTVELTRNGKVGF